MIAINMDKPFKKDFHNDRILFYTEQEINYNKFYRWLNKLDKKFKNSHTLVKVDAYTSTDGKHIKYAIFQFGN